MAGSATPAAGAPGGRALLVWMQANPARLRDLLSEEATAAVAADEDLGPAADPAIRAHLRFVAEAVAATVPVGGRTAAERFAQTLGARLRERDLLVADLELVGEAHAFEVARQFGDDAGEDPTTRAVVERRVRLGAWLRLFLRELEQAEVAPAGSAAQAYDWMATHQLRLADTIFAMDRAAKVAAREREGEDAIATDDAVNRIGQAATVQAHTRFLAEAIARSL